MKKDDGTAVCLPDAILGRDIGIYDGVRTEFTNRQLDSFAKIVALLRRVDSASFDRMSQALASAAPIDIDRVIISPVVTHRLRTTDQSNLQKFADEVVCHLVTEQASRAEAAIPHEQWTALGDLVVLPDGSIVTPLTVPGLRAVDAASPQARSMNAFTGLCQDGLREPIADQRLGVIQAKLFEAVGKLEQISRPLRVLVSTCVLSLVVYEDGQLNLSSSTHGLHIGRVALAVKNWNEASVASILDALVHESIHCMLLMLDGARPLLKDDLRADALPSIVSPWTGTALPVPTYVHAVMVWFGLVHLWAQASLTGQFPAELSNRMMRRALKGFEACDVVAEFGAEARVYLSEHTVETLEAMQTRVRELF